MSLAHIPGVIDAHRRILCAAGDLTDTDCRAACLLPDWTRGHVLTHLARNADAVGRLTQGLIDGVPGVMYPGGAGARGQAIEEGAGRSAAELVADFAVSSARLERLWPMVPEDAWARGSVRGVSREWPAVNLGWMRRREVETHLVDLAVGVSFADLPADFLRQEWENATAAEGRFPAQTTVLLAEDGSPPAASQADGSTCLQADLATAVAWLLGRSTPTGWPTVNWA